MALNPFKYISLVVFLLFFGCNKPNLEDYKGDPGTPGANAAVTDQVILLKQADWFANSKAQWEILVYTDKIDQNVLTKGTVVVSMQKNSVWQGLPYLEGDESYSYGIENGILHLYYGSSHNIIPPNKPSDTNLKIVTVKGS